VHAHSDPCTLRSMHIDYTSTRKNTQDKTEEDMARGWQTVEPFWEEAEAALKVVSKEDLGQIAMLK